MKFSILTPSWNYGRFLRKCIESVSSQSVEYEHLIADNESRDETMDVLHELGSPRLKWWSEADRGQSDALNHLLERARGDIVGWLNADEFYLPGMLGRVQTLLLERPEIDLVFGDTLFVDVNENPLQTIHRYNHSDLILKHRGCCISTCSVFIRRPALEGFAFDNELRMLMDWDLFLNLRSKGASFQHIAMPLGAFRVHDARVTAHLTSRTTQEHLTVRERYGLTTNRIIWPIQRVGADLVHAYFRTVAMRRKVRLHDGLEY